MPRKARKKEIETREGKGKEEDTNNIKVKNSKQKKKRKNMEHNEEPAKKRERPSKAGAENTEERNSIISNPPPNPVVQNPPDIRSNGGEEEDEVEGQIIRSKRNAIKQTRVAPRAEIPQTPSSVEKTKRKKKDERQKKKAIVSHHREQSAQLLYNQKDKEREKEDEEEDEEESSDSPSNDDSSSSSELSDENSKHSEEGNLFEELPTSISLKDGEIHLPNCMIRWGGSVFEIKSALMKNTGHEVVKNLLKFYFLKIERAGCSRLGLRSMRPGKRPKPPLDKRRMRIIEEIFAIHPKCSALDVSVFNNIVNNSLQSASNSTQFKGLDLWTTPIPYEEWKGFLKDRCFKKMPPPDYVMKPQ